uniref:Uncharacterized protein n=1 Tax=Cyprinus carpio carpio TaxID=630221 RepID=A0A9J7XS90_CYPCA
HNNLLPLSTPSKKVTLSNVPPFIPNEVLIGLLARYGKTSLEFHQWRCCYFIFK